MSLTKRGSYSSHVFCHFRMRNSRTSYTHSQKIATPPLVPPRFSRSATFWDERATAKMKFSTSETKRTSSFYFFISEIWMNVRAHLLVPPHFLGSTAFKKMRWKDESEKWFPILSILYAVVFSHRKLPISDRAFFRWRFSFRMSYAGHFLLLEFWGCRRHVLKGL